MNTEREEKEWSQWEDIAKSVKSWRLGADTEQ